MKTLWILFPVFAFIFLTCVKNPQQAGTMSETDTALIYNPDNTPAVGATVKFFAATDSTRTVAYQSTTDANGHYSVAGLTKGSYNMLATKDSLIVFQDSVVALSDTVLVQPDTLEKPGSITGIIGLQPNHDPRTATVEVLGTNIYSNVDQNGRFTLSPIAKGNYNLRLVTTLADYTPTYVTISTQGQKKDTLADTLWMLYTGIPVVTGLVASYDTVNGQVHLSWNKAVYRDFQNYLIFRDAFDSITLSTNPIAACTDTSFVDTIFSRNLDTGLFAFSDTNVYHFKYRVCVENNSAERGGTYKYVVAVAFSPMANSPLLNGIWSLMFEQDSLHLFEWDVPTQQNVHIDSCIYHRFTKDSTYYEINVQESRWVSLFYDGNDSVWRDTGRLALLNDSTINQKNFINNSPTFHISGDTLTIFQAGLFDGSSYESTRIFVRGSTFLLFASSTHGTASHKYYDIPFNPFPVGLPTYP